MDKFKSVLDETIKAFEKLNFDKVREDIDLIDYTLSHCGVKLKTTVFTKPEEHATIKDRYQLIILFEFNDGELITRLPINIDTELSIEHGVRYRLILFVNTYCDLLRRQYVETLIKGV